jgi:DNA replication protein DnaC
MIRNYRDGMPYPALRECGYAARIRNIYRLRSRLAVSGLGQHFWGRTLESFNINGDNRKAFEAVKAWADTIGVRRWLVLTGDVGLGKTHLAAGAMQEKMKQGLYCIYSLAEDVILGLHASYQSKTTDSYIEELKTADLLVVDDLGKESADDKARKFIISIFDSRYESDSPTIVTTNLPYQGLLGTYGKPFISRIAEVAEFIAMKGEDYRLKGAKA